MADFEWAVEFVLRMEGGFQNNPNDKGNYRPDGTLVGTKYGISARSYPHLDIPNLTKDDAKFIYERDYWKPVVEAVTYFSPPSHLLNVFDFGVNAGVARSLRFWRDAEGDGTKFMAQRIRFYTRAQGFTTFGAGWMNRVAHLLEYTAGHDPPFRRVFALMGPLQFQVPYSKASIVKDKLYIRVW